jgi:hypothetical protein
MPKGSQLHSVLSFTELPLQAFLSTASHSHIASCMPMALNAFVSPIRGGVRATQHLDQHMKADEWCSQVLFNMAPQSYTASCTPTTVDAVVSSVVPSGTALPAGTNPPPLVRHVGHAPFFDSLDRKIQVTAEHHSA